MKWWADIYLTWLICVRYEGDYLILDFLSELNMSSPTEFLFYLRGRQWKKRYFPFSEVNFFDCRAEKGSSDTVAVKAGHYPGIGEHIFIDVWATDIKVGVRGGNYSFYYFTHKKETITVKRRAILLCQKPATTAFAYNWLVFILL